MGIIAQGILGGLSGKVGNVIGASWKGIHYIRIKPTSVANPRTEGQVNQRNKFSATLAFLKPSLAFLKVGYRFHQNRQSAFNAAMSYILNNAITGTAPDFSVDYGNALVSRGTLTGAQDVSSNSSGGTVTVTWSDNSAEGNARPDDKAILLAYNAAKKESMVLLEEEITRAQGSALITPPSHFGGDALEVYLAFQAANGSAVSNSSHVGQVIV